jgi:hypothetical protein
MLLSFDFQPFKKSVIHLCMCCDAAVADSFGDDASLSSLS